MRSPRGLRRVFSSGAFRFAFAMALVFAIGAAALLAAVDHSIRSYTLDAVADAIASETAILLGEEEQLGRAELLNAVRRHERAMVESRLRFLLVDRGGHRLTGTLPVSTARVGWHRYSLRLCRRGPDCLVPLLAQGSRLADGAVLVVACDTTDLARLGSELSSFTERTGLAISCFVLLGGLSLGWLFVHRLDRVSRSIERIVEGRFTERLPSIGLGPEFDQLLRNLNAMLDHIEVLMNGLRQVTTDVAHDLRTPLTRLRQQLERMRARVPPDIADDADAALAQTDQLLGMFAALLRIGAMESGRVRALFAPFDVSRLMMQIAEAYLPEIEDSGRGLTTEIAERCVMVGDRELIGQAVTNLVENGMKHTPVRSHLRLSLRSETGSLTITVADDGPGIPEADRMRVFERFYRLDRSRSTPGAGLGLPLVAAVVNVHGGAVVLEDGAPGLIVRMTFSLPDGRAGL